MTLTTTSKVTTYTSKSPQGGYRSASTVDLSTGQVLELVTRKMSSGSLSTMARVGNVEGGFLVYMMYQDYSACWVSEKVRCTAKSVDSQMAKALEMLQSKLPEIETFYAGRAKELS